MMQLYIYVKYIIALLYLKKFNFIFSMYYDVVIKKIHTALNI